MKTEDKVLADHVHFYDGWCQPCMERALTQAEKQRDKAEAERDRLRQAIEESISDTYGDRILNQRRLRAALAGIRVPRKQ